MKTGAKRSPAGSIRFAEFADLDALVAVRLSVRENALAGKSDVPVKAYENFIHHKALLVWADGADIHGFCAADPIDGTIWSLYVRPQQEGRGIGSALLEAACAWLKANGRDRALLATGPRTQAADFYCRRGWQPLGMTEWDEMQFVKKLDSL